MQCATRLWERALVTGSSGNVSARLGDGDILITPSGASLERLTPEAVVRVAPNGAPRNPVEIPSSELPLHLAAYRARDDAAVLVHSHPTYLVLWSTFGRLFPRETVGARESLGDLAWVPYAPPGSERLAEMSAEAFTRGVALILMERHGLSCIANDLERAFLLTDLAEEAARVAYFAELASFRTEEQGKPESCGEGRGMPPHRSIR